VNSCNNEPINLTGWLHGIVRSNPDGSVDTHVNGHLDGTGAQGNKYVLNTQRQINSPVPPSPFRFEVRTVLVSQGSAPNEKAIIVFTPDGFTVETDCRG
jgi:hypothetical protein